MIQSTNLFSFFIEETGNVFSKKYFYLNNLAEKILKIKKNNQDEEKFWSIFFLIMENDELKNFKIFQCALGLCRANFTFSMLNKLKLKNKINEDDWSAIISRIFSEVNNIHNKCIVKERYFLNNEKNFLIMYKNVLSRQKTIKKIQIITEDNPHYKEKYIKIKKNNDHLNLLWNEGKYDEMIEKIKDDKEIAITNIFNLEKENSVKLFFDKKMKESGFKIDGFVWKEINGIFISFSNMRNKFFKKTIIQNSNAQCQKELISWEKLPKNDKKILSRLLLDIYLTGQNFLYLKKNEQN